MVETDVINHKIASRKQLDELLERQEGILFLLFYSKNSQKSLQSLQALENLKDAEEALNFYTVDASEVRDIHPVYNVDSVPTLVVFRNGVPSEIINGVQTEGFYARILHKRVLSDDDSAQAHRVTVYSTPTCPYCTKVKQYLDSKNISYSEVDVAADPSAAQELVSRTGQQGVPQTEIDGSYVIGFNTKEIDRLLEQ